MTCHEWYNKWKRDKIANACILRVTNQCNQKCRHCVFRSGPKCVGQMSVKMCEEINAWVPKEIVLNIMGGEVTVLKNYPELLVALARNRSCVRFVTNGFWADEDPDEFFDTMRRMKEASCSSLEVAVSHDSWHQQKNPRAALLLEQNSCDLGITLVETGELEIDEISTVGRAWDNNLRGHVFSSRSCEAMCNMIITEDGMLGRCPYGYLPWKHFSKTTWYEAQEDIWGWRSEKLADGMDCHMCMETVEVALRRVAGSGEPSTRELEHVRNG